MPTYILCYTQRWNDLYILTAPLDAPCTEDAVDKCVSERRIVPLKLMLNGCEVQRWEAAEQWLRKYGNAYGRQI